MALYIIAPFVLLVVVLIPIIISSSKSSTQAEKEVAEKAQKKKLSGKQHARRIAFVLIILIIIGEIQKVAKGNHSLYAGITNIAIEVVVVYYLVMLVARYLAKRKPKGEQKQ